MNITFSDSLTEKINDLSIKPGDNFINGNSTSAFSFPILESASNTANLVGTTIQSSSLIAEITLNCINSVTDELMSYSASSIVKLIELPTKRISEQVASYTTSLTYTPTDILNKITKGWDNVFSDAVESAKNQAMDKMSKNLSEKSNNISYKVNKTIKDVNENISTITAYISQGPEWLQNKLSDYCSIAINSTENEIGKIVDDFTYIKNTWADNIAYSTAASIVKPINELLENSLKRTFEIVDESKQAVMAAAKAVVKASVMALIGLFGA